MNFRLIISLELLFLITLGQLSAAPPSILQSQVKGLLVIELSDGSHAGTASQMNATAIPNDDLDDYLFHLRFNQEVGEMMSAATKEVEKLMLVRNRDEVPHGHTIEFGFENKHSPKDGPSAAVACAMMAESIIAGVELDPNFAVTGDITATGAVQPVGGVDAKIRGASRRDCNIFAVPVGNAKSISDVYVIEGIEAISNIQILLIENFDDALKIGRLDKSEEVKQALENFAMVSKAVSSRPANARHPKVLEKLKSIMKTLPNHESAKLIALHGLGKAPKTLSLSGSFDEISKGADRLSKSMKDGSFTHGGLNDTLWTNVSDMRKIRLKVDKRTRPYLDSFLKTAAFLKDYRDVKYFTPQMRREFKLVLSEIDAERNKLMSDEAIQEELMAE